MKRIIKFGLAVFPMFLLAACSSTHPQYVEFNNGKTIVGTGGNEVPAENGLEIYEQGTPDRDYKIIGIIDVPQPKAKPGQGGLAGLAKKSLQDPAQIENEIAEQTKSHGGDAAIIIQIGQDFNQTTRAYVIKYVN
jgi:hypothetical protein